MEYCFRSRTAFLLLMFFWLAASCTAVTDIRFSYPWQNEGMTLLTADDWTIESVDSGLICRTEFSLSESDLLKKRYFLRLPMMPDTVLLTINDSVPVALPSGYSMSTVAITPFLVADDNLISVHFRPDSGQETADQISHRILDHGLLLSSPLVSIHRETSAGESFKIRTDRAGADYCTFKASVDIDNASDTAVDMLVTAELIAPDDRVVSSARHYCPLLPGLKQSIPLEFNTLYHPKLWSPDAPALYRYRIVIRTAHDQYTDMISGDFGIRWTEFSTTSGFSLNGIPTRLRGIALSGSSGSAETDLADLELIRRSGVNMIYFTSPPSAYQMMLCDRLGFLTVCGLPSELSEVNQFATDSALAAVIDQYYNHASPILWSVGKEPESRRTRQVNAEDIIAASKMLTAVKMRTPGQGTAAEISTSVPLMHMVDVIVHPVALTGTAVPFIALEKMEELPPLVPALVWMNFPFDLRERGAAAIFAEKAFDALNTMPAWLNGCIFGLYAETAPGAGDGLVSYDRLQKTDAWYMLCSRWQSDPMIHISRSPVAEKGESSNYRIRVFSNLSEAELFINGISAGSAQAPFGEWKVMLTQGENLIRVVGRHPDDDSEIGDEMTFVVP